MLKKSILTVASAGMLAAIALPAFAQTSAAPAPTTSTNTTTSKISCVGAAVGAREQALDAAMNTYTQAMNAAYSTRATALSQAYGQSTAKEVKASVKTAWSTFTSASKTARKDWQSSRNTAWSHFRTAATQCKAPAGVSDSANAGNEASGN